MGAFDDVEARIQKLIHELEKEFNWLGDELRWTIARALVHRGVHHATEGRAVEFCALATYLADMIGHAHKLSHGDNPKASAHKEFVH